MSELHTFVYFLIFEVLTKFFVELELILKDGVLGAIFVPINQHADLQHFIGLFIEVGILIRFDIMTVKREWRRIQRARSFLAIFLVAFFLAEGILSDDFEHDV